MTTLHCREILPYTAKQLYDLVNDIEAYPDFLPWCGHAKVFTRDEHYLLAAIEVTAKGIRKSFTTRNTLVPYQKITMELVKGPFKRFTSVWHFIAVDQESCEVTFDISFAFSNRLLSVLLGKTFNYAAGKMIDAFAQRAASLYGKKN